MMILDIDTS